MPRRYAGLGPSRARTGFLRLRKITTCNKSERSRVVLDATKECCNERSDAKKIMGEWFLEGLRLVENFDREDMAGQR